MLTRGLRAHVSAGEQTELFASSNPRDLHINLEWRSIISQVKHRTTYPWPNPSSSPLLPSLLLTPAPPLSLTSLRPSHPPAAAPPPSALARSAISRPSLPRPVELLPCLRRFLSTPSLPWPELTSPRLRCSCTSAADHRDRAPPWLRLLPRPWFHGVPPAPLHLKGPELLLLPNWPARQARPHQHLLLWPAPHRSSSPMTSSLPFQHVDLATG